MNNLDFVANTSQRCYYCKKEWFTALTAWANEQGYKWVIYGLPVTPERLRQVEQAEQLVRKYCSGQIRVRYHNVLARIEVLPEAIAMFLSNPGIVISIVTGIKKLGFTYVTLDLCGYPVTNPL